MADLKLRFLADYSEAQDGLNKVTGSVQSYLNQLTKAEQGSEEYNNTVSKLSMAMDRDLAHAINDSTSEQKGLNKAIAETKKWMTEVSLKIGEESKLYQDLEKTQALFKNDIKETASYQNKAVKANETYSQSMTEMAEKTTKASSKLEKAMSVVWNVLRFQVALKLLNGVKRAISDSMNVAAEAEQTFSKLATVFDTVSDSADKMASSLASSIGVAKSTAANALSTVGDLLQAQGMGTSESLTLSADWVSQFQDIIAFKDLNMSLEEFAQNFMSGAAGNLRNFRTFGSIVKESEVNARLAAKGYDQLTGSELELAKMTERATMALEQQSNSIGATEREWDSVLSVNRRLSEATKEWKENLGDTLNETIIPIKKAWTEILEKANKAKKAREAYESNPTVNSNVYDIVNNETDKREYYKALDVAVNTMAMQQGVSQLRTPGTTEYTYALNAVNEVLTKFAGSVSDLRAVYKDNISEVAYTELESLEEARLLVMAFNDALEKATTESETLYNNFDNVLESLNSITGAGKIDGYGKIDYRLYSLNDQLNEALTESVLEAFNNITSADLSTFVDPIDLALGDVGIEEELSGLQESLKSLYTTAKNAFVNSETLKDNQYILDAIADKYKDIGVEIENLNAETIVLNKDWEATVETIKEAISSTQASRQRIALQSQYEGQGKSDAMVDYLMTIYDIDQQAQAYAAQLAENLMEETEAAELVQKYTDEAYKTALQDYEIAKAKADEEAKITAELEAQEKIQNQTSAQRNFFSWKNGLASTEDTSIYASVNSWQSEAMAEMMSFAREMEEAGFSVEYVAKEVREATHLIEDEADARKKLIDEELKAELQAQLNQLNKDKFSGLSSYFSWKNGLTSSTDTSAYAEVNSWQTKTMSEMSTYISKLEDLGYSTEYIRKEIESSTKIIENEAEARRKLVDEELEAEKTNGYVAWSKWFNSLTEQEDTSIYAEVNEWQKEQMASMMEYAHQLEELNYPMEQINAMVREATSVINNETQARKNLIDEGLIEPIDEKALFSKQTEFYKWLNGFAENEDTSIYAEINEWQSEQMAQLTVFTTALQELGMTAQETAAMQKKAIAVIEEEVEVRKKLVDEELEKSMRSTMEAFDDYQRYTIFGKTKNTEVSGKGINAEAQSTIDSMYESFLKLKNEMLAAAEEAGYTITNIDEIWANSLEGIIYQVNSNAKKEALEKYNPFTSTQDAYTNGQTAFDTLPDVLGGILGIMMDLVTQTEAFAAVSSILTDHVVPVLDAFLEPILPVIDVIGDLLASIFQTILVPLFPVIVEVSALLTLIIGTIKNSFDFLANVFKWAIGNLTLSVMKGLDKLIVGDQSGWYSGTWMEKWASTDPVEAFKTAQNELLKEVEEIRGLTFDIEENTEDDDFATLKDLYNRRIISADTYAKETGIGAVYSSGAVQASYIDSGNNRTALYGTGTTIYIDGGNWTVQDVINEMKRQGVLSGASVY